MAGRSTIFRDTTFSITGNLAYRANQDVIQLIQQNGGKYVNEINSGLNYLITNETMVQVWNNPYKLQFMPDFKYAIEQAQMYSVPIVDDSFVDECVAQKKKVDHSKFVISAFVIDVEKKFLV